MAYRITANDVRNRLRVLTSADVPDSILESDSYIPASEAWLDLTLAKRSKEYADFDTNEQLLLRVAQTLRCCISVINSAPDELYKNSLQDFKGTPDDWKAETVKRLKREIAENMKLAGFNLLRAGGGATGGLDYPATNSVEVYE